MTYNYYPTPGPYAAPVRSTNSFAIVSFVLSFFGIVGLSVIFAIVALCQIQTRYQGRGLAIAGLAISAAWAVIFALPYLLPYLR